MSGRSESEIVERIAEVLNLPDGTGKGLALTGKGYMLLYRISADLQSALAAKDAEIAELRKDAAMLDWLEANELALVSDRESADEDEYYIWWRVVRFNSIKGESVSGHPLGSARAAIDAAISALAGEGVK